jgi:hypothetical protein
MMVDIHMGILMRRFRGLGRRTACGEAVPMMRML